VGLLFSPLSESYDEYGPWRPNITFSVAFSSSSGFSTFLKKMYLQKKEEEEEAAAAG
jgi:hypothetical protein